MNCIIISTKHGTYQITNGSLAEDKFFNGVEVSAPQEFLDNLFENKELGGNYTIKKWSGTNWDDTNTPVQTFLTTLNKSLEEDIKNEIYGYDSTINSVSFTELADHLICNKQIVGTNYGKNLWYNRNMGGVSLYAFSKNRGVVMSGVYTEGIHKFWFRLYEELKAEQSSGTKNKPVTSMINDSLPGEIDIFEKLTMLVNNNQNILIEKLGNRYIKNTQMTNTSSQTKKVLREKSNEYVGCSVSVGTNLYIVPNNAVKNKNNDTIELYNIETNRLETVDIKTIYGSLYLPNKITLKKTDYYQVKNTWYKVKKGVFEKIEDSKKINEIYQALNSTYSDTIILSGRPINNPVFDSSNQNILFLTAPVGTQIQVGSIWYTKTSEDVWSSENSEYRGPSTIDAIKFPSVSTESDNTRILLSKQQLLPVQTVYTKDELVKMLNSVYGNISSYTINDQVKDRFVFSTAQKKAVRFESDEQNNVFLSISLNPNIMKSSMYLTDLVKACEFLSELSSNSELDTAVITRLNKKVNPQTVYKEYLSSNGITGSGIKSELTWEEINTRTQSLMDSLEIDEVTSDQTLQKVIDKMLASGAWNEFCVKIS